MHRAWRREPAAAFDRLDRPSSRSFSRCAFSVIAANGRTAAGASAQAASSSASSSSGAMPDSSAASSLRSRSARWARYSSSLASGSSIASPCPGWIRSSPRACNRRSPSRYSFSRLLTNTLPSPSTVSPVKAWPSVTNTRWSSAWPGTCRTSNGPIVSPSRKPSATGTPSRAASSGAASEWSACECVSRMPAGASTAADDRVQVRVDQRAGIHHPGTLDDVGVGARERERTRVGRAEVGDLHRSTRR